MDPDVGELAQVPAVLGSFAGLGTMLFIAVRVTLVRTSQPRPQYAGYRPALDEARFARLEQAVDAIGLEIERIAETQRFTTRLLSGRSADSDAVEPTHAATSRGRPSERRAASRSAPPRRRHAPRRCGTRVARTS
jgi:hypothetical protein